VGAKRLAEQVDCFFVGRGTRDAGPAIPSPFIFPYSGFSPSLSSPSLVAAQSYGRSRIPVNSRFEDFSFAVSCDMSGLPKIGNREEGKGNRAEKTPAARFFSHFPILYSLFRWVQKPEREVSPGRPARALPRGAAKKTLLQVKSIPGSLCVHCVNRF